MVPCPNCGADNSEKRTTCFQCQKPLQAEAPTPPGPATSLGGRLIELEHPAVGPQAPPEETPKRLSLVKQAALSGSMFYGGRGQVRRAAIFFRELSALLASGMGMVQALSHLESKVGHATRSTLRSMQQAVAAGKPLSEAMVGHPRLFLAYQVGLVQASELTGALPRVLEQIALHLESDYDMRLDLATRTFVLKLFHIPVLLGALPLVVMLARGNPERWATSIMSVIREYLHYLALVSLPIAAALVAGLLLWPVLVQLSFVQRWHERVMHSIPLVGRIFRLAVLSRFTGMLASLWGAGLPPAEALDAAALASGSRQFAERIFPVSEQLYTGTGLSAILEQVRLFDRDFVQFLHVGEVSGSLPEALSSLASRYQSEYERLSRLLPVLAFYSVYLAVGGAMVAVIFFFFRMYIKYAWLEPAKWIGE